MIRRLLLAVLAAFALQVQSQQQDAVSVTASRFSEEARRMPASVTVITAKDIARSTAYSVPELLAEQVGITVKDLSGANGNGSSIDLRGYGATGGQNTLVLVDGRRYTDIDSAAIAWSSIPVANIERIEILRGTGAVLYGDGASAGVVNIVTRSPQQSAPTLTGAGRVATYSTREGHLSANTASQVFGLNATAHGYSTYGFRQNSRNEQRNLLANARWVLGPGYLDLRIGTDTLDAGLPGSRRIQPSSGTNQFATDRAGAQTPLDYSSRDGRRVGLAWNQQVGDAEVSIGFDWRDRDSRGNFVVNGVYRADNLRYAAFTPRARLPFNTGGIGHRLTVGLDASHWRYMSRQASAPQHVARPINFVRGKQEGDAFYINDSITFSPETTATLGWRRERARLELTDTLDVNAPGFNFNTGAGPANAVLSATAWEIGLRRVLTPQWSGYVRSGQSFRFAKIDEVYETDLAFNNQFQILRPQRALTHEVGAEWHRAGQRGRISLFVTRVTDEIHLDPFTAGTGNTNLPPSRRAGLETDGSWQALNALRLWAGYAYTRARFIEGVLPGGGFALASSIPIGGKTVPLVPTHKLNLGATVDLAARTQLTAAAVAVSSQFTENDEPNSLGAKIPAYVLADVKLSHALGWGRLSVSINNLFDRKYYNYAVRNQFNNAPDRYAVFPLPGRTLGISAEIKLE